MKQTYHGGDLVRILKGRQMTLGVGHRAIVKGSYADLYGGSSQRNHSSYALYVEEFGDCSWFDEEDLELIEHNQWELYEQWKEEKENFNKRVGSIDWIFANGEEVLRRQYGSSIQRLANELGCTNLWGSRGEGFIYAKNSYTVLKLAEPYLIAGDKEGFLKFAKRVETTKPDEHRGQGVPEE